MLRHAIDKTPQTIRDLLTSAAVLSVGFTLFMTVCACVGLLGPELQPF